MDYLLTVFAIPCLMATFARSAPPLPEWSTLVESQRFQDFRLMSDSLTQKILLSIPDTHKSCIQSETLKLNSSENAQYATMVTTIGIRPAPVLSVVSENYSLETSLRHMSEGFQLHRDLLSAVSPRLANKDNVTGLVADIRDLVLRINEMLKMAQTDAVVQPSPTPVALNLPGNYEVQVAAHMILVQLQAFGQDTARCLRSLNRSKVEETQS
uniref:Granulocyte colony stimulating factor 1 n=1 Tax=Sebastes schlegelii TaxID=214486 RepID=C0STS2_SEBSC|nr:granulocyte colony stimulating factor 1 [Sebastes schlegelii]BAH90797.1 granulocyte colony-stimulating factor 2 [Sebastes schlegelii]